MTSSLQIWGWRQVLRRPVTTHMTLLKHLTCEKHLRLIASWLPGLSRALQANRITSRVTNIQPLAILFLSFRKCWVRTLSLHECATKIPQKYLWEIQTRDAPWHIIIISKYYQYRSKPPPFNRRLLRFSSEDGFEYWYTFQWGQSEILELGRLKSWYFQRAKKYSSAYGSAKVDGNIGTRMESTWPEINRDGPRMD